MNMNMLMHACSCMYYVILDVTSMLVPEQFIYVCSCDLHGSSLWTVCLCHACMLSKLCACASCVPIEVCLFTCAVSVLWDSNLILYSCSVLWIQAALLHVGRGTGWVSCWQEGAYVVLCMG